jgi:transposase-like protein
VLNQDRVMPTIARRLAAQHERDRLQARRLRAAELFAIGVRQAEVARRLGVSRQSVHLWHQRWQAAGTDGCAAEARPDQHPGFPTSSSARSNKPY